MSEFVKVSRRWTESCRDNKWIILKSEKQNQKKNGKEEEETS